MDEIEARHRADAGISPVGSSRLFVTPRPFPVPRAGADST